MSGNQGPKSGIILYQTDTVPPRRYEFYRETIVGGKWLCVVARYNEEDAFVVTAYLTDKPKQGEDLWPAK